MQGTPDTKLWHPFADMATVRHDEFVIDRADGVWVFDDEGNRYFDGFASLWYANAGHGRREIAEAVSEQMRKLDSYTVFFDYANKPALDVAERVATLSGLDGARVMLGSGGGDAVDTAAKLARRYFFELGQPERTCIVSRTNAYHGTHGWGTSLSGIPANRQGWGEHVSDTVRVAYDSVDALRDAIAEIGADRIAAFFCEPVVGAGGVLAPPDGYIEGVAALCREHGILFVCDSVICGFGRLGTWFGIERWDVTPDLIVFAKGITSGYLPLGGLVVSGKVAEPFWSTPGGPVLRHGPTWSGHPACCAAALANLDVIEREGLLERGMVLERQLDDMLKPFAGREEIAEIRSGTGALAAVQLTDDFPRAGELVKTMRREGVLVRALDATSFAICPPLTAEAEHVDMVGAALQVGLDELVGSPTLGGVA